MEFKIQITDKNGNEKKSACGSGQLNFVYKAAYEDGDTIHLSSASPCYVAARLEDSLSEVFGYLSGEYRLAVPFGEKKVSYSPKSFSGDIHLLSVRLANDEEIARRRNLAFNPLDSHDNTGFYPHASANVETRGESVFAARNAIDGFYANDDHGPWPYQSWGINQNPDAEIKIYFGREVSIDEVVITLRADFPHDNWWHSADIVFSNGYSFKPQLVKTGEPQHFTIPAQKAEWALMKNMKKDENDSSPFPALTQIEFWGI